MDVFVRPSVDAIVTVSAYIVVSVQLTHKVIYSIDANVAGRDVQEGQHPLTGQRAANFRLLASQ